MAYKVVRPFVYSTDGIHGVELVVGDVRDDFGDSTAGLLAEKYIEVDAAVRPDAGAVETDGAQVDNGGNGAAGVSAGGKTPRSRRRLHG